MSFNHFNADLYVCDCGKKFLKSQSFNAHKSHCKEHYLKKYGNLEKFDEFKRNRINTKKSKKCSKKLELKDKKYLSWLEEKHVCETCGIIMTSLFGSGRYCSRKCANSRKHSEITKLKIKTTLLSKHGGQKKNTCVICNSNISVRNKNNICINCLRTTKYGKNLLHDFAIKANETKSKNGYTPKWLDNYTVPKSERFWTKILNMFHISYEREVPVKHINTNYMLDFYIEINDIKIDLEIDGSYHNQKNMIVHDLERDNFLKSQGFIIYRIPWKSSKSKTWKRELKQYVYDFVNYLRLVKNQM